VVRGTGRFKDQQTGADSSRNDECLDEYYGLYL
jgi:hypothetical protein